ncbi:MAG: 5-(carboxyamino)imidazole ribonucleotide synthase [Planctomycetota bacterium]
MTAPILPGATLGVLGGGQLGRMFAIAARRMGYGVAVFAPEEHSPAGQIADLVVRAPYDDLDAVRGFARQVSVVTYEFENVPAATTDAVAQDAPTRPAGSLLATTQDRLREKDALRRLGLPTAEYRAVESPDDVASAARSIPGRGVLKTASWGYDGKGQRAVDDAAALAGAWEELGSQRAVLEAWVPFEREVSVVGARGLDGEIALFEPFENAHADHILDVTSFPARLSEASRKGAHEIARSVLEGLDVVGVLCVEMFHLEDGRLLVNELAPRPHNSGHVTIDTHATSQFEQQVRAICGLPLGDASAAAPAGAMANLLGDLWSDGEPGWGRALALPGVQLHLYGKDSARPGRKMGHLSAAGANVEEAVRSVVRAREALA